MGAGKDQDFGGETLTRDEKRGLEPLSRARSLVDMEAADKAALATRKAQ